MVASSSSSRSITVASSSALPRVLDAFVGNVLELVIHSIEGLRERIGRVSLR